MSFIQGNFQNSLRSNDTSHQLLFDPFIIIIETQTFIKFQTNTIQVSEGDGVVPLVIVRTGNISGNDTISFSTSNDTASPLTDYTKINNLEVTFLSNETTKTVNVSITDDVKVEENETFYAHLTTSLSSVNITDNRVSITILDDDKATIAFISTSYTSPEGNGLVTLQLSKTDNSDVPLTVSVSTANLTAYTPSDYTAISETITFGPSETVREVNVTIIKDGRVENDEIFQALLTTSNFAQIILENTTSNVTIKDGDKATIAFISTSYTSLEGNGLVTLQLSKTDNADIPLTVSVSTANLTAYTPSDYTAISETITFAPSETVREVNVTIIKDGRVENDEIFQALLTTSNFAQITLENTTSNVTIKDGDKATIAFISTSYTSLEGNGLVTLQLSKTDNANIPLTVSVSTANLTAYTPSDYTAISETITFAPSETVREVNVTIIKDGRVENDEIFQALLTTSNFAQIILENTTSNVTIKDGDKATIAFISTSYTSLEGNGLVTLQLSKTDNADIPLTVSVSTANLTAYTPSDYTAISETITFAPSETVREVNVTIIKDGRVENDEIFQALLTTSNFAQIILENTTSNVTIKDGDKATIAFISTSYTSLEGNGLVTLQLSKTDNADIPLTVSVSTANLTAYTPSDYTAISETITFAPSETVREVNVTIIKDGRVENDEIFQALLTTSNFAQIILENTTSNVTIKDGDKATIAFISTSYTSLEGNGLVTLQLSKTDNANIPLTVSVSTANLTAYTPSDYTAISETITFAPSETVREVNVTIIKDGRVENDEIFQALLTTSNFAQIILENTTSNVTIKDGDKATIAFISTSYTSLEGNGLVTLQLSKTDNANIPLTVSVSTANLTAYTPSDYTAISETITFAPSETVREVNVTIIKDGRVENDEIFQALLTTSNFAQIILENTTSNVTIKDGDKATIAFISTSYTSLEGNGLVTLQLSKTDNADIPLTVSVSTANLTAYTPSDYTAISETITFAPSETVREVNVTIIKDGRVENDEIFQALLTASNFAQIILENTTSNVTIKDGDKATIAFISTSYTSLEGNGLVTLQLSKTDNANIPLTVSVSTANLTAYTPSDYTAISETITFAPSETVREVNVTIIKDGRVENDEIFQALLTTSNFAQIILENTTSNVTIKDGDKATIAFISTSYTSLEGNGLVTLQLSKTDNADIPLTVSVSTANLTAYTPSDYTAISETITFAPSETVREVNVTIIKDGRVENDEIFQALLTTSNFAQIILENTTSNVTIKDGDKATIAFISTSYTSLEGNGLVTLQLSKTDNANIPLTVSVSTANLTAYTPSDYTAISETITFAPSETVREVNVTIIKDGRVENDEIFQALLSTSNSAQITLKNSTSSVTIKDDDKATITFKSTLYTTTEDSGFVTVILSKTDNADIPLTVSLSTSGLTATSSLDYTAISNQGVTLESYETTKGFNITIETDIRVETDEEFQAFLSNPNPAQIELGDQAANITIKDDDKATIGFKSAAYNVTEDQGFVTIEVTKSNNADVPLTVSLSTADLTAKSASDYIAISNRIITFKPGETSHEMNITIKTNEIVERNEEFKAVLTTSNSAQIAFQIPESKVTINDDDKARIGFTNTSYVVIEGHGYVTVTITKEGESDIDLAVIMDTVLVSASSPLDYVAFVNREVLFPAASPINMVNITIETDGRVESHEVFRAKLTVDTANRPHIELVTPLTEITIVDDDKAIIGFNATTYSVAEGQGFVVVEITKSGHTETTLIVRISTEDGTAKSSSDFIAINNQDVIFAPDENAKLVNITIVTDNIVENDEVFVITLTSVNTSSITLNQSTAYVNILNDNKVTVEYVGNKSRISAKEGETVELTYGITNGASDVNFTIRLYPSPISTTAGEDDFYYNDSLTFLPDISRMMTNVTIVSDREAEGNESIALVAKSLDPRVVIGAKEMVVILIDDSVDRASKQEQKETLTRDKDISQQYFVLVAVAAGLSCALLLIVIIVIIIICKSRLMAEYKTY
ncbi:uncharacterized protein LOC116610723 isoform X2 [Nematostella vectensis]|uniref:uncharacterized protein LOC116610723 isoform X2 n=1 Tax=Nematostella vectensis TaxID=45351 RepID=UPI0020773B58|nr:uncharacterized protein LOC116610723 isoform X2 [Nematostella vectensis]